MCVCVSVLVTQSCSTLCDPMVTLCNLLGSSVHGILQARILEWIAVSYSRDLPDAGMEHVSLPSPALAGGFFTTGTTWEAQKMNNWLGSK